MANVLRDVHFGRSLETSQFVLPLIEEAVSTVCVQVPAFKGQCDVFLHRRRNAVVQGRPMLRPYLARALYELGGGERWQDVAPALAAVELHNISTYQTNLSFDGKIDWPHATTSSHNQVMAAMISLAAAHALIERCAAVIGDGSRAQAVARLHEANAAVYLGQYLDLNVLTSQSLEDVDHWLEDDFRQEYLRRCRLMGGGTFISVLIGHDISPTGQDANRSAALHEFLALLGLGTQVTNDLGDYYLEGSRPYSASFMDLRRGRLTLPTFRLLRARVAEAVRLTTNPDQAQQHDLQACVDWLIENGIYAETRDLLESEVWPGISAALKALADSGVPANALTPLSFARPFLFHTKYMRYFKPGRA